ncbi:MAG: CPXCG motif-containing cysteine-rich protein [Planctomycetaceae bacterium]|nr:CPXCG motif-containing cysteine-rich protein [Planctomycetaceae bacterium]
MDDEGTYVCPSCWQEIVIPVDPSQGALQTYEEDCPVCCHPNLLTIELRPQSDIPDEADMDPEPRVRISAVAQ